VNAFHVLPSVLLWMSRSARLIFDKRAQSLILHEVLGINPSQKSHMTHAQYNFINDEEKQKPLAIVQDVRDYNYIHDVRIMY